MALKTWLMISALFLGLAVAAGAFGAHGLRDLLDDYSKAVYEKAVLYQFIHAMGMFVVASLGLTKIFAVSEIQTVLGMFALGIIFFSGSLYALAITGVRTFGAITPIGGTLFLLGWGLLAWRSWNLVEA